MAERRRRQAGFTLIEIMVVMVIIGLLMALVGPNLIGRSEKAKTQAAAMQIERLGTVLDTFRLDIGRYPTTQEGLQALVERPSGLERWDGPYLNKAVPKDPWDRPYVYRSPGDGGRPYDIYSLGADGAPGGQDKNRDITSWGGDNG
ncbi:MAG TPA: type II secretion system major pseudopilin GspG [Candidatus Binatia bacterium]|jgi:general secretion pathway protein G|nr:type II secretion system major pseudopilin GspG [Candidatus Binatia bacterium]